MAASLVQEEEQEEAEYVVVEYSSCPQVDYDAGALNALAAVELEAEDPPLVQNQPEVLLALMVSARKLGMMVALAQLDQFCHPLLKICLKKEQYVKWQI